MWETTKQEKEKSEQRIVYNQAYEHFFSIFLKNYTRQKCGETEKSLFSQIHSIPCF